MRPKPRPPSSLLLAPRPDRGARPHRHRRPRLALRSRACCIRLLGPDHLLAMIAVGLFAAMTGGRARWAYPASFVAAMIARRHPRLRGRRAAGGRADDPRLGHRPRRGDRLRAPPAARRSPAPRSRSSASPTATPTGSRPRRSAASPTRRASSIATAALHALGLAIGFAAGRTRPTGDRARLRRPRLPSAASSSSSAEGWHDDPRRDLPRPRRDRPQRRRARRSRSPSPTPATGRSRSARTTISPRPTPRSTSTAPPPAAAGSTSPPAPPSASSPARPARSGSSPYAGARRVFGFNAAVMGDLE